MTILCWDKPKKIHSTAEWADISFDGGPKGGYVPNMSEDDAQRWKAKLVGTKAGYPQVEIRKKFGSALATIIVSLGGGYNYKQYTVENQYHGKTIEEYGSRYLNTQDDIDRLALMGSTTLGINVHMAMNGPAQMTFADMENLQLVVAEARAVLEALEEVPGLRENYVATLDTTVPTMPTRDLIAAVRGVRVNFVFGNQSTGGRIGFSAPKSVVDEVANISAITQIISLAEAKAATQVEWDQIWKR